MILGDRIQMKWSEEAVIDSAIKVYARCGLGAYRVHSRPDKLKNHRNQPEIDATATAAGKPNLAIEHTRLQSFDGQLMDDSRIKELCVPLAKEIAAEVPNGISCVIPILAFVRGFSWNQVQNAIREYLTQNAKNFPTGISHHGIADVPFPVKIHNDPDSITPFYFVREAPSKSRIERELVASMELALGHKKDRLQDYRNNGNRSVLLVESSDTALINHIYVYTAYLTAQKTVEAEHLTDLLYGMTGDPEQVHWLCFKGAPELQECLNPPNFMIGTDYEEYWTQPEDQDE
jgi:hypothetical protein